MTLALGIGAATAVFSVVNGVLIKPLPSPDSERLVSVWNAAPASDRPGEMPLAATQFFTYRDENRVFAAFGLWSRGTGSVRTSSGGEEVLALQVRQGTLEALGVAPALGRWFSPEDDAPGSPESVVLGAAYWQRRYGGERFAIGRALVVDARPRTIIGVMPAGFRFLDEAPDVILPLRLDRGALVLGAFNYFALGRLRPGATGEAASADLARMDLAERLHALVVGHVALALLLLVGAGLMIRTFVALRAVQPGFTDPGRVQLVRITIPRTLLQDPERVFRMQSDIRDRLAAIPGAAAVSMASAAPMEPFVRANTLFADQVDTGGQTRRFKFISPGYFATVGTPVIAGRDFDWTDLHQRRPVAVIVYSVTAHAVAQRTGEIGIRVALGARPGEVTRMFIRQGAGLGCLGALAGLSAAATLAHLMSSLLFGISPLDPATYVAVGSVVVAPAALASYIPARKATAVDAANALRAP